MKTYHVLICRNRSCSCYRCNYRTETFAFIIVFYKRKNLLNLSNIQNDFYFDMKSIENEIFVDHRTSGLPPLHFSVHLVLSILGHHCTSAFNHRISVWKFRFRVLLTYVMQYFKQCGCCQSISLFSWCIKLLKQLNKP